jgi:two-component system NtrC family response regulator
MRGDAETFQRNFGFDPCFVRLRILVVDDDERCLASVEAFLAHDGHDILTATRGLEAVDHARRLKRENRHLDLSILDFNMPDITGIETFERLVAEIPGIPAIFISGDVSSALEQMVFRAGGRALVRKPLDIARIRSLIREIPWPGLGGDTGHGAASRDVN